VPVKGQQDKTPFPRRRCAFNNRVGALYQRKFGRIPPAVHIDISFAYAINTLIRHPNSFPRRMSMKLTPPKQATFWIAVVLGLLGLLGAIGILGAVAAYSFWLAFAGFALLVLGLLVKGL
jgi:hypothetical protein